jgi:hypothetical protein
VAVISSNPDAYAPHPGPGCGADRVRGGRTYSPTSRASTRPFSTAPGPGRRAVVLAALPSLSGHRSARLQKPDQWRAPFSDARFSGTLRAPEPAPGPRRRRGLTGATAISSRDPLQRPHHPAAGVRCCGGQPQESLRAGDERASEHPARRWAYTARRLEWPTDGFLIHN